MTNSSVKILGIALCVLCLCAATAIAQDVRLEYKFKAGNIDRYKETMHNDVTGEMMPSGGQMFFSESFTTHKVEKVNADGSADIIRTIDSVNSTLNGQPFPNPQTAALIGLPIRVTMTITGKVLDVKPAKEVTDATVKQSVDEVKKQLMSGSGYPARGLKMKDSWKDSAKTSRETQAGTLTTDIRYSTTLTGTDKLAGLDVMVLERVLELSGEMGGGAGSIKGTGKGNIYFSNSLGKEVKTVMDMDQVMDMSTPQGMFTMNIKVSTVKELMK